MARDTMACPHCECKVLVSEVEKDDGLCPECGQLVMASNLFSNFDDEDRDLDLDADLEDMDDYDDLFEDDEDDFEDDFEGDDLDYTEDAAEGDNESEPRQPKFKSKK